MCFLYYRLASERKNQCYELELCKSIFEESNHSKSWSMAAGHCECSLTTPQKYLSEPKHMRSHIFTVPWVAEKLVLQGFTRDSWKPSGFRSKCHRLLGAVPLVALPTMKKQGFARLSYSSSYRSHVGPGVPANANRTSMGTNIAKNIRFTNVFKVFWETVWIPV